MNHKGFFLLFILLAEGAWLPAQDVAPWQMLHQTAKTHLKKLIQIDTSVSNPDEISAARYIYKQFNKHKIDWDIFIPHQGRANLMARIKGTDPSQKPLLLISHLDTTNVQEG